MKRVRTCAKWTDWSERRNSICGRAHTAFLPDIRLNIEARYLKRCVGIFRINENRILYITHSDIGREHMRDGTRVSPISYIYVCICMPYFYNCRISSYFNVSELFLLYIPGVFWSSKLFGISLYLIHNMTKLHTIRTHAWRCYPPA